MKYHCGHQGCDVCGVRQCTYTCLKVVGKYSVCESCLHLAVKVAVNMAETFGGTIIDLSKPCEKKKE